MPTRRQFGLGVGALATGGWACTAPAVQAQDAAWSQELHARLAEIETRCGGRLGVGVVDMHSDFRAGYREHERFPLCSTYKALAAAAVLAKVDSGGDRLDRRVRFEAEQVLSYSPGTKTHAGTEGMTLGAVCDAAVTLSDNTAGNLLLNTVGGPVGFTGFLRGISDGVTRLDRTEPTLNEALPGDPRDTTTPSAMADDLDRLILGNALSPSSRALLTDWFVASKTGDARLRAGVPSGWKVGDKTGTGEHGTSADVGVIWPPGRKPLIVTVFLTGSTVTPEAQSAAIADVARAIVPVLHG